ncbi:MAG: ELM1/GtrOC1 family putative glycosyltransferase [Pseudomonadota bacterium]
MLMTVSSSSTRTPDVWVLQTARAGDSAQARALAEALGWPYELKDLRFNALHNAPNAWLGGTRATLNAPSKRRLEAPWPDLVIAVARRTVPVARWIRAQSGGRTRLVHLGRPRVNARHFDLVVSTPQYAVPEAVNVFQIPAPLHGPPAKNRLDAWLNRYAHLPRPWTAIVLGGEPWPYRLDETAAKRLAAQVNQLVRGEGSVIISDSPRTPAFVGPVLERALDCAVQHETWKSGDENPYPALLQLADRFVVTGDSASMLAETCGRGRPVFIFDLPSRPLAGATAAAARALAGVGVLHPPRDMSRLHDRLIAGGHAERLGARTAYEHSPLPDALPTAVARIRELFSPT